MIAIYARQSVEKEDSISIESQIEICEYEARGEAYLVYSDKGFSGKNTNRPEFQRMMSDIKSGRKGITKVIVYRLDRISRSILDFSNMMDTFSKKNVEFSSATERFDTSTPMGRAMLNICITFAQLERETTQQRVRDTYVARSQKGFYMGGKIPVGFRKVDLTIDGIKTGMFEQIPEEVDAVKMIFEMYADVNNSNSTIAEAVRNKHSAAVRERIVTRARIQDFVKNPIYVKADINIYNFFKSKGAKIINPPEDFIGTNGCYLYTGDKGTRKQTDLSNAVLVIAPHEGFIDSELWIACRERALSQQQIKRNPKAKNTWLAGLIKCGNCGYAIIKKTYEAKNVSYFLCSRKMNDKLCTGAGRTIHADDFENAIYEKMKEKLADYRVIEHGIAPSIDPRVEELKLRVSEIETEILETVKGIKDASSTVMRYINENVEILEEEKRQTEAEIQRLSEKSFAIKEKVICDFERFSEISFEQKRAVANAIIKKIYVSKDKIDIVWNL